MALGRSTTDLAHQLVQLLLVEDALAFALELVGGRLGQSWLVHDAATDTAAAAVGRATGVANPSNIRNGSRHLGSSLVEDFGNRQFGLQVLRCGLGLLRVRVRMSLLLRCADHAET